MVRLSALLCVVALLSVGVHVVSGVIKVDVYLEALCPYCELFVTNKVAAYMDAGLGPAMDLTLYYAGNVKPLRDEEGKCIDVSCQHGKRECFFNKVAGCGIARKEKTEGWFPFILCIEDGLRPFKIDALSSNRRLPLWAQESNDFEYAANWNDADLLLVEDCSEKNGLKYEDILDCAEGQEGIDIQIEAYKAVDALIPPAPGVPWIVVDGTPYRTLPYSLVYYLCEEFDAASRPEACNFYSKENGDAEIDADFHMCMRGGDQA